MLNLVVDLVKGVMVSIVDLGMSLLDFGLGIVTWLHIEAPRLEGLLVGVGLAWLMMRRDKHPLLRALSAPLKLVVDVLDLIWDQAVEFVGDVWGVAKDWAHRPVKRAWSLVNSGAQRVMAGLRSLKSRLSKKSD
mgnify:CR=1 FL=1